MNYILYYIILYYYIYMYILFHLYHAEKMLVPLQPQVQQSPSQHMEVS